MKNKEFFQREIAEIAITGSNLALSKGKLVACDNISCKDCDLYHQADTDEICTNKFRKWAEAEHRESIFDINPRENLPFYYVNKGACVAIQEPNPNSLNDFQVRTRMIRAGNACTDRKYMEKRAREIRLYNLLSNFAHKANEDWIPDWDDDEEDKWFIRYNNWSGEWVCDSVKNYSIPNVVYFESEDLAKQAIWDVVIPFTKDRLD